MTIEVRQLQINSSVGQLNQAGGVADNASMDEEQLKAEIIDECRQLLKEMLREGEQR